MALLNYVVAACTSNPKGGFLTKIQTKTTVVVNQGIFGSNNREQSKTYYAFGSNQLQVGSTVAVDVDLYNVKTSEYEYVDKETGVLNKIDLKYLAGLK